MIDSFRRIVAALLMGAAISALAACGTTSAPPPPRMVEPPPSPDEALADYRQQIENQERSRISENNAVEGEAIRKHTAAILGKRAVSEFELFMYINKAADGPTAQRAYLFDKNGAGELRYLDTWLVSTGREDREVSPKGERKFTTTPEGVFQFDVNHFVRLHKSNAWEADMPWAMFLRTRSGGPTTGIALHASLDKYIHNLGQRASAGCIRLLPSNAEKLYKLLQTKYAGMVPNTSTSGRVGVNVGSSRSRGAKALVIVEDLDGAALMARSNRWDGPSAGLNH